MLIVIKFFVFVDKKTLNFCILAFVFALFYRGFALFPYCFFAKIRKYIGISKFIGEKVQIVETPSAFNTAEAASSRRAILFPVLIR